MDVWAQLRDRQIERVEPAEVQLRRCARRATVAVDYAARLVARPIRDPGLGPTGG
jgi:hypothetical protein